MTTAQTREHNALEKATDDMIRSAVRASGCPEPLVNDTVARRGVQRRARETIRLAIEALCVGVLEQRRAEGYDGYQDMEDRLLIQQEIHKLMSVWTGELGC